jgi:hypothetical protein
MTKEDFVISFQYYFLPKMLKRKRKKSVYGHICSYLYIYFSLSLSLLHSINSAREMNPSVPVRSNMEANIEDTKIGLIALSSKFMAKIFKQLFASSALSMSFLFVSATAKKNSMCVFVLFIYINIDRYLTYCVAIEKRRRRS